MEHFDLIVLGAGPAGETVASRLANAGLQTALVEQELIGGECAYWACIPSKTLLRPGEVRHEAELAPGLTVPAERFAEVAKYRDYMIRDLDDRGQEKESGGIPVDERCRAAEGVWAIGDVTGQAQFTHVAMYQGRIACADIAGRDAQADYQAVPRVVFCDPEVASVGMNEAQARDAGVDVATSRVGLGDVVTRPATYETDPRGELELVVDRNRQVLAGVWAVGPLASEWIHYAALAVKAQLPLAMLKDTVAQFPTYTEAYLKALEQLDD